VSISLKPYLDGQDPKTYAYVQAARLRFYYVFDA
jgi:hypothetical protein